MGQYKPKTSRRELLPAQRALIVHKYQDGATIADIHREFKTPRSTIRSILDRYQNYTGFEFKNKPRCGVKPKLNLRQERALIRHADKNPKDSLFALVTPSKSGRNAVNSVGLKKRAKGTGIRCVGRMKLPFILVPITQCFGLPALLERERSGLRRTLSHHLRVDDKL
jgi:hypothetical protein